MTCVCLNELRGLPCGAQESALDCSLQDRCTFWLHTVYIYRAGSLSHPLLAVLLPVEEVEDGPQQRPHGGVPVAVVLDVPAPDHGVSVPPVILCRGQMYATQDDRVSMIPFAMLQSW